MGLVLSKSMSFGLAFALTIGPAVSGLERARAASDCDGVPVRVDHASAEEFELACDGARAAFAFLRPLDLRMPVALSLELTDQLPEAVSRGAVGCFEKPTQRVIVLRLERFAQQKMWFGLPIDAGLYRAVFAHEVAHAISARHAGELKLSLPAQEYAAYVTMLATMTSSLRDRVLERHPGSGFDSEHQINEVFYALDPTRFAVDSYRHWLRQPDPSAFLRRVLDGAAIPGLGPAY